MTTSRREFLVRSAGMTTLLGSGITLPGFLSRTASASSGGVDLPVLVVVQLTGGNDGLNTVVPYEDDRYHRARPSLRVTPEQVLRLEDGLGLHPEMSALKDLYDDGLVSIINNVGYPNPDRSHFRSMDIWHTASTDPETATDGWLGRVVDRVPAHRDAPLALHLDNDALPLALRSRTQPVPSVRGIESFRLDSDTDVVGPIQAARQAATDDLLFVQRTALAACANAERLQAVADPNGAASQPEYPNFGLADRLRQIATLIASDFGARIYYTSLGGFDTHARQVLSHGGLLREFSESVAAFQRDISGRGVSERVVVMTFSEFGRRVHENGSRGTDHGAAAPMFVIGDPCRPGIVGAAPDLGNLRDGDVAHTVDFRDVYATLLDGWLDVRPDGILQRRSEVLPLLAT